MNNSTLERKLKSIAFHASKVSVLQSEIAEYCLLKYGHEPGDVDNDQYIDGCTGASGVCSGMTVEEFHLSMVESVELHES